MKKLSSNLQNMIISLVGICIVVSTILATLNYITKDPIEKTNLSQKLEAIKEVTPMFDNNPYNERFRVLIPNTTDSTNVYPAIMKGNIVGYAIDSYTEKGFAGHISIMVGFDNNGHIVSYKVLDMSETPGLGTKMKDFFKTNANNGNLRNMEGLDISKYGELSVAKDGGNVDAISAATISSRAFLDAINRAYSIYKVLKESNEKKN